MGQKIGKHTGLYAPKNLAVNLDNGSILAAAATEAAAKLDPAGQIMIAEESVDYLRVNVIAAREARTSHTDCNDGFRRFHFVLLKGIV